MRSVLEIEGKPGVVPQPFPSGEFHDIAGDQLDHGGDQDNADKYKDRCDRDLADGNLFGFQPVQ